MLYLCVCLVLLKVYCGDHTYTTIRVAVAGTGREVISAVADKLATTDELVLVHLSSASGKNTHRFRCESSLKVYYKSFQSLLADEYFLETR